MRDAINYAAFLIPRLFVGYTFVAVFGAFLFFLVSALYVYPVSSLVAYGCLIIGSSARGFISKYLGQIHPIRMMNSLILH